MSYAFWEKIAETPWWFYVICIAFIRVSLNARKPKFIHLKALFVAPLMYIVMSAVFIATVIPFNLTNSMHWLGGFTLGTFIGWIQFRSSNISAVKDKKILHFPGSRFLFALVLILIGVRYFYFTQLSNLDPSFVTNPHHARYFMLLFGLFTGLFVGKIAYAVRVIKLGPFHTLPAKA